MTFDATADHPASDTIALRLAIVDGAIALFRQRSVRLVGVQDVAAETGLTVAQIEEQFPTWDDIELSALDRWNGRRVFDSLPLIERFGTVRFLRDITGSNITDPSLGHFMLASAQRAATPGDPLAPRLHRRWQEYQRIVQDGLVRDIELGREPDTMSPCAGSEQLIALSQGLQIQWMMRPGLDLLASFDRAVARLREGWSSQYVAPMWELDPVI